MDMSNYFLFPNTPETGSSEWGDRVDDLGISREGLEYALRYSGANTDEDDDQSAHEVYTLNLRQVDKLVYSTGQVDFVRPEDMERRNAPDANPLAGSAELGGSVRSYWPVRRFADAVRRGILVATNAGRWQLSLVDVDPVSDIPCRQYWRYHGLHGQALPEPTLVTLGDVFPERRLKPSRLNSLESFRAVMLCNFLTPRMTMSPPSAENKTWITTASRSGPLVLNQRDSRNNLRENRFVETKGRWGPDPNADLILRSPLVTRDWLIWGKREGGDDKLYLRSITGTRVPHPRDDVVGVAPAPPALEVDASTVATKQDIVDSEKRIIEAVQG